MGGYVFNSVWERVVKVNPLETRNIEAKFLKLTEELGELAAEVIALRGQTYKEFKKEDLIAEMADTLLMIFSIFSELLNMTDTDKEELFASCEAKLIKWESKIRYYKVK